MQIRKGFISNSSSSSFIVAFPQRPTSKQDVQDMLFTKYQKRLDYYDYSVDTDRIAENVWADIQIEDTKMTKAAIREQFSSLYWDYCYTLSKKNSDIYYILNNDFYTQFIFQDSELSKQYQTLFEKERDSWGISNPGKNMTEEERIKEREESYKLREELKTLEKKIFEIDYKLFLEKMKGKFIRVFSYSDNDGEDQCVMEHGGIFSNVEHIRISHH